MRGNPHAPSDLRIGLNSDPSLALWLGLPAAREHFDPSALSASDRARGGAHGPRRRADVEVSRALLAFADVGTTAHSLSHSAEHAALLIASTGWQIGVDLEVERPRDALRLARFAFTEREAVAVATAPAAARPQLFYTLWTLKESFAKALRLSLVDALGQCVFWEEAGEWRGEVPTRGAWSAAVFQPRPGMFLAVACVGAQKLPRLQLWEWPPKRCADWPLIAGASAAATM